MESVVSRVHDLQRSIVFTAKKRRVNKSETEHAHAHADIALEAESSANESNEPD